MTHVEYRIVTWGGVKNSKLQKIRSLQKKAIRAVNNSTLKAHSNPLFSKLKVLNLDDTYKLSVLTFMHGYFNDNLLSSFQNIFKSLARTESYKLESPGRKHHHQRATRNPVPPETPAFSTETQKFSSETPNKIVKIFENLKSLDCIKC